MAVIEFLDYKVNDIYYQNNKNFNNTKEVNLENELKFSYENDDEHAKIVLELIVGTLEDENVPFKLKVTIEGNFRYNKDEDDSSLGFEDLILTNSSAILYPYLRSTVSIITNLANSYPTFNLPTINVGNLLDEMRK